MVASSTRTAPRSARHAEQATSAFAYHGRRYLGAIISKGDQFEAWTPSGMNLGRFYSTRAGWTALAEHDQKAR